MTHDLSGDTSNADLALPNASIAFTLLLLAGCGDALAPASALDAPIAIDAAAATDAAPTPPDAASACATDLRSPPSFAPLCSRGGWCWENPLPLGNHLTSVWGAAPGDLWAVGAAGTILHWDGTVWSASPPPVGFSGTLSAVAGSARDDVWAVGDDGTTGFPGVGVILHWDGAAWTRRAAPHALYAVWASGRADAWAAGAMGTLLHWDGTQWEDRSATAPTMDDSFISLSGSARDDLWMASTAGGAYHWTGMAWHVEPMDSMGDLHGVHAVSASSAFAAGANGAFHWDGRAWSTISHDPLLGVFASADDDAWLLGRFSGSPSFHWNGTTLERNAGPPALGPGGFGYDTVFGTCVNDLWAVGPHGLIAQWNGQRWTASFYDAAAHRVVSGIAPTGDGGAIAVGEHGLILRSTGGTWWEDRANTDQNLRAVFAQTPDRLWAVGDAGTILYTVGQSWFAASAPTTTALVTIWGSGDVLFAGGPGGRLRYADGTWSPDGTSPTSAIAGSGANDVWACGSGGVAHWDGQSWQALASPTTCTNLWVAGPGDVWLTSARHLLHGGVGGFVQNDPPYLAHAFAQNGATAVWARSPNDVWVTGSADVYHWDGAAWSLPEVLVEAPDALLGVTGDAQSTWLLGSRGIILHK